MPHQKRLIMSGIFIAIFFVMGYVYDVHPLVVRLRELNQAEINANKKLLAMKSQNPDIQSEVIHNHYPDKNELSDISRFISFIHSSGLIIQTSNFLSSSPIKSARNNMMHLVLRGDYQQLVALINGLEKHLDSLALQDFSYKLTERNDLLITLDILSSGLAHKLQEIGSRDEFVNRHNPFCITANMNKWIAIDDSNAALSAPIERIKMVGFLQRGLHRQALVLLPNTVMRTVEPGFLLGSEKGVVVAVYRDHTLVKLPDGRGVALALTSRSK